MPRSGAIVLRFITFLFLILALVACGPSVTPTEVWLQVAIPTPTLEPTFTPAPMPEPVPTASATPTLIPTPTPLGASLRGRILDQTSGGPVANATVNAGVRTSTTDIDGRYALTDLPPGQFILSVIRDGYDPALSAIVTLTAGQSLSLDLTLYSKDTSPYPKDPMLTNPLDPAGAPTAQDAERLARSQGLAGEVTKVEETRLRGTYLVNYKRGGEVRATVASLDHDAWTLTDTAGQTWWIIKVCGNLARPVPAEVAIATPQPRPLPPLAEVLADGVSVRACASETCAEVGTPSQGQQVEVFGCLADGRWCQVGIPGGGSGWCTGRSLRQLAVAQAVPEVEGVLPTPTPMPTTFLSIDSLVGMWRNVDSNTRGWSRIEITREGNILFAHFWGACTPTECDAGVTSTTYKGSPVRMYIDHGFATRNYTLLRGEDILCVTTFTHFKDNSGRADYTSENCFRLQE